MFCVCWVYIISPHDMTISYLIKRFKNRQHSVQLLYPVILPVSWLLSYNVYTYTLYKLLLLKSISTQQTPHILYCFTGQQRNCSKFSFMVRLFISKMERSDRNDIRGGNRRHSWTNGLCHWHGISSAKVRKSNSCYDSLNRPMFITQDMVTLKNILFLFIY